MADQVSLPKQNNLEWLRLVFACQVLVVHVTGHLQKYTPPFILHFPGVPAFFFVSGLLIYSSYRQSRGVGYFRNRFLRIFPGLLLVCLGGLGVVILAKGSKILDGTTTVCVWFLAQLTIGQSYNPEVFRDIGVGVINGSLWTITVEVVFYVLVPLIVRMERHVRHAVVLLATASCALYVFGPLWLGAKVYGEKSLYEVLALTTPLPWGWMFCSGILAAKYFAEVRRISKHLWMAALPLLLMIKYGGDGPLSWSSGNRVGVAYFYCYSLVILFVAFGVPYRRLPFDLSYGIYIWHMPVINTLLVLGMSSAALAMGLTTGMAVLSWCLVERPALGLKRKAMRPIQ